MRISACLIVKDEESHLERCLSSLMEAVDEIVVVDTGSHDRTAEIARSFGAVVGEFQWCNDFSAARNASLELATGDWVLWIDADEELTGDSADVMRTAVEDDRYGGYEIEIYNLTDDGAFIHYPVRLFRRAEAVRFTEKIHEQITPGLEAAGLTWTRLHRARMLHYGYTSAEMESKGKLERTLLLLQNSVRENPNDPFQWFNLANAYWVGRCAKDAEHAARMCEKLLPANCEYGSLCFQIQTSALAAQGKFDAALDACDRADEAGYGGLLNEFERGSILLTMGRLTEADGCTSTLMALPETRVGDVSVAEFKRHVLRAQVLTLIGKPSDALPLLNEALAVSPTFIPGLYSRAVAQEQLGDLRGAASDFEQLLTSELRSEALKGLSRINLAQGNPKAAAELAREAWMAAPEDQSAWTSWVTASEFLGDSASLVEAYEQFARRHELSDDLLVNWGRALKDQGDLERALECYAEAIKRNPSNANALFNCGDLLYAIGAFLDAAQMYEAALRIDPSNADGWFTLGNSFAQMGMESGAITSYNQALAICPTHERAQHNLQALSEAA